MKLRPQITIFFSGLFVVSILVSSLLTFEFLETAIINNGVDQMMKTTSDKAKDIQHLHDKASEDIVFAVKNPTFVKYFELPETQAGNVYDENNVKQFTAKQHQMKAELDTWIYDFQSKFSVDETCLIDATGQEHTRLTFQDIASDDELSSEEELAPFFEPSFMLQKGQVHLQFPYVSPDSHRWVFAYTTPIVTSDNSKPAFYHFEMPITIFQDLVKVHDGRMYVIDPDGFIIADSKDGSIANSKYNVEPKTITNFDPRKYFPSVQTVHASSDFQNIFQEMQLNSEGFGTYSFKDENHYVAYKQLSTFGWVVVYDMPENLIMSASDTPLGNLAITIIIVALFATFISIYGSILISNKVSKPILNMNIAAKKIANGDLSSKIQVLGNNEVTQLAESFNIMTDSIKNKIDLEKELAVTQTKLQNQKMATIGELSSRLAHDLRNPLSLIKNEMELYKIRNPNLNEAQQKSTDRVNNAIKKISRQIEVVLDFVRTKPLQITKTSLNEIINSSIESIALSSKIQINYREKDFTINGDPVQLEVVFSNIILNASQALRNSGKIHVKTFENTGNLIIEIQDSGPGIPENKLNTIFEPLYTTKQVGTGLGLSSCKNIVELHGGTISVKNNPTTFTITIPKLLDKAGLAA